MNIQTKKRVLIITYYWPPSGGAGVQRWLKFAKYLPEYNWQPIIFTPENPEAPAIDHSLQMDISPEIEVIKNPIWEPYSFYKRFTGKDNNQNISAGFLQEKKSNPFLEKISVFIRGNFFIPDARKFWIRPSVRFLSKYLMENKVDMIISTGPPHSMHLIAMYLKKKLELKWIADFRDPWTNIDFYKDLKLTSRSDRKHKKLEKKVLTTADVVIGIGDTLVNELRELGAKNVQVLTNGYDLDDLPDLKPDIDIDFSIVHVGSLNKDRNHTVFWKAISQLISENTEFKKKLRIKLIGKVDHNILDQIEKLDLSTNFEHLEYIAHNQVMIELLRARLLYLPINNTPNAKGIVTGKFFEYLASNRCMLIIGPIEGDIAKIIENTKSGKVFDFGDILGVKNYIAQKFMDYLGKKEEILNFKNERYSRKNITGELSKILDNLSNE